MMKTLWPGILLLVALPLAAQQPQEPLPFQPIQKLTGDGVLRYLGRLGFYCEPAEESPSKAEEAFRCGLAQGPGQHYTVWLVAYKKGVFLSMTVNALRGAGGTLDLPAAMGVLKAVASLPYPGADPEEVKLWLSRHVEQPLETMARPEVDVINPRTGQPFEVEPLMVGGMVFKVVGFPASPGIDISVQGY